MKLDILAFAAHPDDVELSCSGTIATLTKNYNKKVGVIDLTQGELGTRGNAKLRLQEAKKASKILNLSVRKNLCLEDGFFRADKKTILKIITSIRTYQPEIILCNARHDRHPDHGRAYSLIHESAFLSGLSKISTWNEKKEIQKRWKPKYIFSYIQDTWIQPDFVFDISNVFITKKMKAIEAYKSQFYSKKYKNSKELNTYISSESFLSSIKDRAAQMGKIIGVQYGEGFNTEKILGINNFENLVMQTT